MEIFFIHVSFSLECLTLSLNLPEIFFVKKLKATNLILLIQLNNYSSIFEQKLKSLHPCQCTDIETFLVLKSEQIGYLGTTSLIER